MSAAPAPTAAAASSITPNPSNTAPRDAPVPLVSIEQLCAPTNGIAAAPAGATLVLPTQLGKYPTVQCTFAGRVRSVTVVTPRLTFLMMEATAGAAAVTSAEPSPFVQLVVKFNDATGFTPAQHERLREHVRVGDTVVVHAFLELAIGGVSAAAFASSGSAFELFLHVISIGRVDNGVDVAGAAAIGDQCVRHSRAFAETIAAVSSFSAEPADDIPRVATTPSAPFTMLLPDIAIGIADERGRLNALQLRAEEAAQKAALLAGSSDPVLSLKEAQKKANRERQKGVARARLPKCNVNRGGKVFEFLAATFGVELLKQGGGVLDVAGGAGVLAFQFSKRDLPCTVVDPRIVEGGFWASRRRAYDNLRAKLEAEGVRPAPPPFRHIAAYFNPEFLTTETTRDVWETTSLVVGLHPDEATEDLVSLCLRDGKPFAVIPCCVFPNTLHPTRRNRAGEHVRTHEQLCAYYRELDEEIQQALLPFDGRNVVLFRTSTTKRPDIVVDTRKAHKNENVGSTESSNNSVPAPLEADPDVPSVG